MHPNSRLTEEQQERLDKMIKANHKTFLAMNDNTDFTQKWKPSQPRLLSGVQQQQSAKSQVADNHEKLLHALQAGKKMSGPKLGG